MEVILMLTMLPNTTVLQQAKYTRVDNDLHIRTAQETIVIEGYFKQPVPLITEEGMQITVADVMAQLSTATGEIIGYVTTLVNGPVSAESATGEIRVLQTNDPIYLHDTLFTAPQSYIKITLNDNSIFQLGPLTKAQLDKYSYDPQTPEQGGQFAGNIFLGIFRFISGQISNDSGEQHTTFNTPSATIGIRGSEIDVRIDDDGATTILHSAGLIEVSAHYSNIELSIYESNTLLYIPITPMLPTIQIASPEQIAQMRGQFTPLDFHVPQEILPHSDVMPDMSSVGAQNEGGRAYPDQFDESNAKTQLWQPSDYRDMHHEDFGQQIVAQMGDWENKPPQFDNQANISPELPPFEFSLPSEFIVFEDNSIIIETHLPQNLLFDITQPTHGYVVNNWDGSLTYTPQFGYFGKDFFQLQSVEEFAALQMMTSQFGYAKTTDNHTLSILAVTEQDENIAYTITQKSDNNYQVEVTIKAQLIDFPALGQNAEYTQPLYGQLQTQADGQLRYLPPENFHGTDSFTYRASPEAQFITVKFQIEPMNDSPMPSNDTDITLAEDTALALLPSQLLANDSDADGDSLSIISVNSMSEMTDKFIDLTHGQVSWNEVKQQIEFMPTLNYFGQSQFTYTVVDLHGARSTATVTMNITPVNDAPITQDDQITIDRSEPIQITADKLLANDSDVENEVLQLIRVENAQNGSVAMDNQGTIIFTPDDNFIQGRFDYFVTDNVIDQKTEQLTETRGTVQINTPFSNGLIQAQDDSIVVKSSPFTMTADQLLANDKGDRLQIVSVNNGINGEVILQDDGNILFVPNSLFTEQGGEFHYTISNNTSNLSDAHVTLTAMLPTVTALGDTISIGSEKSVTVAANTLISNDFSEHGAPLTITAVTQGQNGTVVLEGDHITFIRNEHFIELGDFFYTVSDGNSTNTAQVIVTGVEISYQTPVIHDDVITIFSNAPQTIAIDQLLNNDENANKLTLTTVQDAYQGNVVINGDSIVFTPSTQLNCVNNKAGFSYSVINEEGISATAQVVLTANPMPPLAQADEIIVKDNAQLSIDTHSLLSNDNDPYQQNLTIVTISDAISGGIELQADQTIIFTPNNEFITTRLGGFSYTVSNGCDTATAMVTVRNENIPPIAQDDNIVVNHVKPTEIDKVLLLDNDSDDNNDILHISAVSNPISGTVQLLDTGNILFTPSAEFVNTGIGGFMVTVTDNHGGESTAMVSLTPDNRPPIATSDSFEIITNAPTTITVEELLANDTDPEGDPLTIIEVNQSIAGNAELLDNGQIQFTPSDDFITTQIGGFTYTISDGNDTSTAVVSLNYKNLPPNAVGDNFDIATDATALITVESLLSNDTDPQNESLTLIEVDQAVNGSVELLDTDHIQFTPSDDFIVKGSGSFSYTIADTLNNQSTAIVTLTAINNPPTANDDELTVTDITPIQLNAADLLTNDTDFEQDSLNIIKVSNAMNGEVVLNADQTITFTSNATFEQAGIASFVYVITDDIGGEAMATATFILDKPQIISAINDVVTVPNADTAMTIPSTQLLANDIGEDLSIISFSRNVVNGSVQLTAEGDVLFTPKAQFAIDRAGAFSYVISDGEQTAIGLVSLRIGTNISPDGKDDMIAMMPNTLSVAITYDTLLSNDFDIDGDSLTIIATKAAENGFITTSTDEIIFFPDANFSTIGQGSFEYVVADGKGGMDVVNVNIMQDSLTSGRSGKSSRVDSLLDESFLNFDLINDHQTTVQPTEKMDLFQDNQLRLNDILDLPNNGALLIEDNDVTDDTQSWGTSTTFNHLLYNNYTSGIDLLANSDLQNQIIF